MTPHCMERTQNASVKTAYATPFPLDVTLCAKLVIGLEGAVEPVCAALLVCGGGQGCVVGPVRLEGGVAGVDLEGGGLPSGGEAQLRA